MANSYDVKNYKMFQKISAGGVVLVKEDGKWMVVTIEREKMNDKCLPKGHQDEGESLQDTARREIFEETGYKAEPVTYLDQFTYSVKSDTNKTITLRTVHWFLMEANENEKKEADEEIRNVKLYPLDGDFSFLTYDNDRMFITKAQKAMKDLAKNE